MDRNGSRQVSRNTWIIPTIICIPNLLEQHLIATYSNGSTDHQLVLPMRKLCEIIVSDLLLVEHKRAKASERGVVQ
jgi:hypothetical protein